MNIKIAPSILSGDFSEMGAAVEALERCGADLIHCDVMDGSFVPPITFGAQMVKALRPRTKLPLDCHLMVLHPETQIESFAEAGADYISVHAEACEPLPLIKKIHALGAMACAVVNPETDEKALFPCAEEADMLLVMSVRPGWGGQKFMPAALKKIETLRAFCIKHGFSERLIEVDGGVSEENAGAVISAGANVLVAGSAVFRSPDMKKTIAALRGGLL